MRAKDACIKALLDIRQKKAQMRHDEEMHPLNLELMDARIEQVDAATQRMLGENVILEDTSDADELIYGTGGGSGNENETQGT